MDKNLKVLQQENVKKLSERYNTIQYQMDNFKDAKKKIERAKCQISKLKNKNMGNHIEFSGTFEDSRGIQRTVM